MGLAWLFSNQLMINLTIQISDNPLDEFQEIQRMADQVRENINQLQNQIREDTLKAKTLLNNI